MVQLLRNTLSIQCAITTRVKNELVPFPPGYLSPIKRNIPVGLEVRRPYTVRSIVIIIQSAARNKGQALAHYSIITIPLNNSPRENSERLKYHQEYNNGSSMGRKK